MSSTPMETFPPGLHAVCAFTISVWGPMDLALSAIGAAVNDELLELLAFAGFVPVFLAGLTFVLATRGAIIGNRSPRGLKVELEILAFQTELLRDRSLRRSLERLGLNPRPFLSFRRAALVMSLLIGIGSMAIAW